MKKTGYMLITLIVMTLSGMVFAQQISSSTALSVALSNMSSLTESLSSVYFHGLASPMIFLNDSFVPVVSGDENTSTVPSVLVGASSFGSGRLIVVGNDGFLTNPVYGLFDNTKFGDSVFDWLDLSGSKKILLSVGHSENFMEYNSADLRNHLASRGYTVTVYSGLLDQSLLSGQGVLIVGNANSNLSGSEISAIKHFVENGGSLLMTGLGWSRASYFSDPALENYPMNALGKEFGVKWTTGFISSPTNNYDGQPVFHLFYPYAENWSMDKAFWYLNKTTMELGSDLPNALENNASLRSEYSKAHIYLATLSTELPHDSIKRGEIFDFYVNFIKTYPLLFRKNLSYDSSYLTMRYLRERSYSSLVLSQALGDGLTSDEKVQAAEAVGLYGGYFDLWNNFSIMLLDNNQLDERQQEVISDYYSLLPPIHDTHVLSVFGFIGWHSPVPQIPILSTDGATSINIGTDKVGKVTDQNQFPPSDRLLVDLFCTELVHESNHLVDTYLSRNRPGFSLRKSELISRAGDNHLNYLKSYFVSDGNFPSNPGEFFAAISQQYFADSGYTLRYAIRLFNQSYTEPINQFLLFADAYSTETNQTYFYTTDLNGNMQRQIIPLTRNKDRYINGLVYNGSSYLFDLDSGGYVTKITTTLQCPLAGDTSPCGYISLAEVITAINDWTTGNRTLNEVITLINSWAASS
jgi:hypothetical protein